MNQLVELATKEAEIGKSNKKYSNALKVVSISQIVILMSFICLQYDLSQTFFDTVAKYKESKNTLGISPTDPESGAADDTLQ